jgi:hypothetical protein
MAVAESGFHQKLKDLFLSLLISVGAGAPDEEKPFAGSAYCAPLASNGPDSAFPRLPDNSSGGKN